MPRPPKPPPPRTKPTRKERFLASLRRSADLLRSPMTARELAEAREAAGYDCITIQSAHEHLKHLQALGCRFEVETTWAAEFGPPAKRFRLTYEPPGVLPRVG